MRAFTQFRGLAAMRSRGAGDGGFTMVELAIAMGVILATLVTMVTTTISSFGAIGIAKQRQVCTSLANETVEQVRGLPFATLTRGLGLGDLQAGGDSAITSSVVSGVTTYFYGGEPIPTASNPTTVPLVPHTVTKTVAASGSSKTFTLKSYLTYYQGSLVNNTFRLTVDASCPGIGSAARHVVAQTVLYQAAAPGGGAGGCPFNAPCTSFFDADANVVAGNIDVTPTAGSVGVAGLSPDLGSAHLWEGGTSSSMAVEQVSGVQGTAATVGPDIAASGQAPVSCAGGRLTTASSADNDPETTKANYDTHTVTVGAGCSASLSGGGNSISVTTSAGDTATSTSTTAADSVTNLCRDAFGGTYQSDSLPCGSSKTLQQVTQTIGLDLTVAGSSLGHAVLGELDPAASETRSFTNRDANASGTTCLSDGCIEAKQTRALGTTVLGRLPANVAGSSGFSGLVKITGYTDVLDVWAGLTATAPSVSRTGTVSYWNGTGYSSIGLAASGAAGSQSFTSSLTATLGTTTVHIAASLRTGAVTLTDLCSGTCTRSRTVASAESPIVGDITYRVDHVDSSTGQTVVDADLIIHVDLGTSTVKADYEPATS